MRATRVARKRVWRGSRALRHLFAPDRRFRIHASLCRMRTTFCFPDHRLIQIKFARDARHRPRLRLPHLQARPACRAARLLRAAAPRPGGTYPKCHRAAPALASIGPAWLHALRYIINAS
ncbi:hypothetical protein C7S16_1446 [Burkholderia thailandensis]|uniref:Uncharacterized protein n=1 Tax=Burkholderia thailandensis TaxID=57975 RepID=A0AAW9CZC5_BURTH|nr:hypothetical protein [Burkholderia thailandensis]